MKNIRIHKVVVKDLKKLNLNLGLSIHIAELPDLVAHGESLGMPISPPMPDISIGVHELRVKDSSGQYRVFYFTKTNDAILSFHLFKKKSQATPKKELELAKQGLRSMK